MIDTGHARSLHTVSSDLPLFPRRIATAVGLRRSSFSLFHRPAALIFDASLAIDPQAEILGALDDLDERSRSRLLLTVVG